MVRLSEDIIVVKNFRRRSKLTDLTDTIEVPSVKNFADTHELKRAVYG